MNRRNRFAEFPQILATRAFSVLGAPVRCLQHDSDGTVTADREKTACVCVLPRIHGCSGVLSFAGA